MTTFACPSRIVDVLLTDLGWPWLVRFRCACGREAWQRPELWRGTCHACSSDCLIGGH